MKKLSGLINEYWSIAVFFGGILSGVAFGAVEWHKYNHYKVKTDARLDKLESSQKPK